MNKTTFTHPELPMIIFHEHNRDLSHIQLYDKTGRETFLDKEPPNTPITVEKISEFIGEYYVYSFEYATYFAKISLENEALHIISSWGINTKLTRYSDTVFYTPDGLVVEFNYKGKYIKCEQHRLIRWNPSFTNFKDLLEKQLEKQPNTLVSKAHLYHYLQLTGETELRQKLINLMGED